MAAIGSDRRPARGVRTRLGAGAGGWLACLILVLAGLLIPPGRVASGSDTQWWITDSVSDYTKSESRGVVVDPDGVLELGPSATQTATDSLEILWAIAVLQDGSVALAGDGGRIDRWTESGGIRPWIRLPVGQVLSIAADGDGAIAGTGPEGWIYRIGARGDTTLLARTGERYVWGLAPGRRGVWYAATGTRGKLLKIEGRRVSVALDTDEGNLVSLVSDGHGGAFAGGDSEGHIVHVRADGGASTVFDAPEDEVRGLALGADGALYAAALSAGAVNVSGGGGGGGITVSASGSSSDNDSSAEKGPKPVTQAVSGGKATVYRIVPDSSAVRYWSSPQPFVFALAAGSAGVFAATGNRAGVYRLDRPQGATQWLAASEGQVTALAIGRRGEVFAATSNPGALWRLGPGRAARGELLSETADARRIARFGRIRWRGEAGGGRIELFTRSGNTDPPDTTWSRWQGGAASGDGLPVASPPGRYLQWKITLAGGHPRIESVETAWREQNLPPHIEDLNVAPQGRGFREGDLIPRSEPITQTLPGGQKVQYSISSPKSPGEVPGLPSWARGLRTAQWKASDPNGDPLVYRVDVRSEGSKEWIQVAEDLTATAFTWDTSALPDGRYRLRIVASDSGGNPVGEEQTAETLSRPFTVDNTPPEVTALEANVEPGAIRFRGRAADAFGPLGRIEVSLDGDDWRAVAPEGGLTDQRAQSFHARLTDVDPGPHTLGVRAVDLAGNSAMRAVTVTVPASH